MSAVWMGGGGNDGGIYIGGAVGGVAEGKGVILYGNGGGAICDLGELKGGVRHGFGQEVSHVFACCDSVCGQCALRVDCSLVLSSD